MTDTRTIELSEDVCLEIEKWHPDYDAMPYTAIVEAVIAARPAPVVALDGAMWTSDERGWGKGLTKLEQRFLDRIYELENPDGHQ